MAQAFHIDCFSALDDVPKKYHSNKEMVLAALLTAKRLSSFELQDSRQLASTVTALKDEGKIKLIDDGYPWYRVEFPLALESEGR